MLVTSGKNTSVTSVRPLQDWNAYSPMLVATGNDTLVSLLQDWNALPPMLVALGKDTSVRFQQDWNAF